MHVPPQLAGKFRQAAEMEHRRRRREPPKTLEDARAIVQAIAKRQVENDRWVKMWRFCKQVVYLFALVGAYLLYYLIGTINEALSLLN